MSFLGRSGGASSSGVNPERVEMAMQEFAVLFIKLLTSSDFVAKIGYDYRCV